MINSYREKLWKWFIAFIKSPCLELFTAFIVGVLSLQTDLAPDSYLNKVVNAAIIALIGGSVPFLIKLYIKLSQTTPTVEALENVLSGFNDLESRLLPNLYVTKTMKSFHEQWIDWRNSLKKHGEIGELEELAWTLLAEAYLSEESQKIASKHILTNTNRYTILIVEANRHLEKYHSSSESGQQKIARYHLTGMLPEEFYNGSQIEFITNSSQPIFFGHKWENYQEFYTSAYKGLSQRTRVKRCIVVRQTELRREEISALSTLEDLEKQAGLSIINRQRQVNEDLANEPENVKMRLFRKCFPQQQNDYEKLISSILGRHKYNYWPIAETEYCDKSEQWVNLLDFFSKEFHGNQPNDALYCALTENTWYAITRNKLLEDCFKPGWIPEIVLFGGLGDGMKVREWYFGILGHWRPFTSDIELRFLTGKQTQDLYHLFKKVYKQGKRKGNLSSLKKDQ